MSGEKYPALWARKIQIPEMPEYETEQAPCMYACGDPECREWANLKVLDIAPTHVYHVPECQMIDLQEPN